MLKLPKGLKKKKKGKKSKRKGEDELFTEEELEKYRKEHQQQASESSEGQIKENEEWSKFKDLTTGIDSVLKKTQGDLDRIKSTSFFQRIPAGPKEVDSVGKERPQKAQPEIKHSEIPKVSTQVAEIIDETDKSDYAITDTESEEEEEDDIFDTSYVDAVERGEVKLTYVPDSPDEFKDDDIFDTSHVDALIKGQETKTTKGKKALDIGVAVEVLTGRIDNVTITTKKSKRVIPGDLLLENNVNESSCIKTTFDTENSLEKSILDTDTEIPITSPIDLSVSLHTSLQQQNKEVTDSVIRDLNNTTNLEYVENDEDDEFTILAAESLGVSGEIVKLEKQEIEVQPVLEESWSAFEANKNDKVFAESIIEDQIDVDPFLDEVDPFDTSFADSIVPSLEIKQVAYETVIFEEDDDFNPRSDEIRLKLNNRRRSSVRIHLTDPTGLRESITSDDIIDKDNQVPRDLLGGSTTDLTQLGDLPLSPGDIKQPDITDPFDTTLVDKIVAPGKIELKLLEQELIGVQPIYRVESDPDFDPRADEITNSERRASRPENLIVSKSVIFNVEGNSEINTDFKGKSNKPLTPYYTRELSITEDLNEEEEAADTVREILPRTRSDEDLNIKVNYQTKRRHSEYPHLSDKTRFNFKQQNILEHEQSVISTKVLTPSAPNNKVTVVEKDPFDTSFAKNIAPSKTELKLLAKEFSCEDSDENNKPFSSEPQDLLDPSDDIFQVKALTPEPTDSAKFSEEGLDPFDTSFASNLQPGRTEIKLLESEFLN